MKIKNYLVCFVIAILCMAHQKSLAQPTFTLPVTTVCGLNDLLINVNNPESYQTLFTYINGIKQNKATMPSVPTLFPPNFGGIVVPYELFKSGINTISITGNTDSRKAFKVTDNSITIDGVLDENTWKLNNMLYQQLSGGTSNPLPNGINSAVNFGLLWDNNGLYIGIKVVDNTMFTELTTGATSIDAIEIYIDPYKQAGCYTSFCSLNYPSANIQEIVTRQLIIDYNAINESNLKFWENSLDAINAGRSVSGITMAVKTFPSDFAYKLPSLGPVLSRIPVQHRGTGFIIEMSIPWSSFFGISTIPGVNHQFGFDIAYNDNQGRPTAVNGTTYGRNEQSFWESSSSNAGNRWQSAADFGYIELTDLPDNETLLTVITVNGLTPNFDGVPTITGTCSTSLSVSPPTLIGYTTYWQTASSLESTLDPATMPKEFFPPITSTGLFYNAKSAGGCWSETNFVPIVPANPFSTSTISGITPECGLAILSATVSGIANIKHFWQTTSTGTSQLEDVMLLSRKTVTGASNSFLNIRSFNTVTGCWSIGNNSIGIDLSGTKPPAPDVTAGIDLLSSISGACVGKTALVYYTKSVSGNNLWYWQTEPLGTSTGFGNDTLLVTTSTAYLRNQLYGCWSDRSVGISVDLADVVVPSPTTKNYTYFQNEATVPLALTSTNTLYGVNWYVDSQTAASVQVAPTPTSTEIGTKNYFVSYTKGICESTKAPITVEIKELVVLIPKKYGMTPNGSGPAENEKFEIDNITSFAGNKVTITDKWGNIVFEKENYDNSFDGKRDGKDLPFGSYLYIVNLNNGKTPLTGTLVITR